MKKITLIILVTMFFGFSCKTKKEEVKAVAKTEVVESKEEPKAEITDAKNADGLNVEQETYVIASIERTVCFGACPTFTAVVYSNGEVIYKGKANVKRIGTFKGKVSQDAIENLRGEVESIGFMELKNKYDSEFVMDVPSTITYVNFGETAKKILCRFECDERLEKINVFLDSFFEQVEYKKIGE